MLGASLDHMKEKHMPRLTATKAKRKAAKKAVRKGKPAGKAR